MDGLKTGKLGGALWGAGSLLPFFSLYLPSCTQKPHFIYLFLSFSTKVPAALHEGVALVGNKNPTRYY